MATLTADEITLIRNLSGDNCEDYDVSDAFMQYLHDNMATAEPLCASSIPFGGTIVWVLRARLAKAQRLFDEDGENARNLKQKRDHIKEDLEMWESRCGMNGGVITTSTISTGLDRADPQTEYARWTDEMGYGLFL